MTAGVEVGVRSASEGDVAALAESHRHGQAAVVDSRGGPLDTLMKGRPEPIDESFVEDLHDPLAYVRVGTVDGVFVGYCVMRLVPLRTDETLAVVSDLWVHPESRGIGVGYALMRDAEDRAVELGCMGIDARALPGDRATKNFFESFGLVARAIEVHREF